MGLLGEQTVQVFVVELADWTITTWAVQPLDDHGEPARPANSPIEWQLALIGSRLVSDVFRRCNSLPQANI